MMLSDKCMCGHILMRHAAVSAGNHGGKCGGFVRIDGRSRACACEAFVTPDDAAVLEAMVAQGLRDGIEEHIWGTYGGVTRSASPEAANWKLNAEDPSVLTLEKLTAMVDTLPKMPKFPPYYRCNINTYHALKEQSARKVPMSEFPEYMRHLSAVEVRVDHSVPEGEFLPPEGWEP